MTIIFKIQKKKKRPNKLQRSINMTRRKLFPPKITRGEKFLESINVVSSKDLKKKKVELFLF